jgi:trans-aconitate methyltransferase
VIDVPPAAERRWLAAQWEFVQVHLPPAPARVVDLGCGPYGGFVPMLRRLGHSAVGVDTVAPDEPGYHRVTFEEFEEFQAPGPIDALIACTSLHHIADLPAVLDRVVALLRPGGVVLVVEWDWRRFDEATARWCFDRLDPAETDGWLHRHRARWRDSGTDWPTYLADWAAAEHLHAGQDMLAALAPRLDVRQQTYGPYFHTDLLDVSRSAEEAAIAAGEIRATGMRFVGTTRC